MTVYIGLMRILKPRAKITLAYICEANPKYSTLKDLGQTSWNYGIIALIETNRLRKSSTKYNKIILNRPSDYLMQEQR